MYSLLIADDESLEREAIRFFVKGSELKINKIIECVDGNAALNAIDFDYDICILDIKMPGKSGLEILREIKANNADRIVIIQSAYSDFNYAVEALRLGAFDYLVKPTEKKRILNVLRRAIDSLESKNSDEIKQGNQIPDQASALRATDQADVSKGLPKEISIARSIIFDKYSEQITLDTLAKDIGLSKYFLAHSFKEHCGKSVMAFLIEVRIGIAKELLTASTLTVTRRTEVG